MKKILTIILLMTSLSSFAGYGCPHEFDKALIMQEYLGRLVMSGKMSRVESEAYHKVMVSIAQSAASDSNDCQTIRNIMNSIGESWPSIF